MPNKTPNYKDKVLSDFEEEFYQRTAYKNGSPAALYIKDFISQALEEQMKLVMECLPMNMETDPKKYSGYYDCLKETRENLKSKGLI